MKNSTMQFAAFATALACGVSARADQAAYQIDVARASGTVSCQIVTASGATSTSCTTTVSEQGHVSIAMNPVPSNNMFAGADRVTGSAGQSILAVVADSNKMLKDIVVMRVQSADEKSFDGSMAITEASTLTAVNIESMHLDKADPQNIKLEVTFIAYSPAATALKDLNTKSLAHTVEAKLKPLLTAF